MTQRAQLAEARIKELEAALHRIYDFQAMNCRGDCADIAAEVLGLPPVTLP